VAESVNDSVNHSL